MNTVLELDLRRLSLKHLERLAELLEHHAEGLADRAAVADLLAGLVGAFRDEAEARALGIKREVRAVDLPDVLRLSEVELHVLTATFCDWRDRFTAIHSPFGDVLNDVAAFLAEERDARRRAWRKAQAALVPKRIGSEPATWEGDEHVG